MLVGRPGHIEDDEGKLATKNGDESSEAGTTSDTKRTEARKSDTKSDLRASTTGSGTGDDGIREMGSKLDLKSPDTVFDTNSNGNQPEVSAIAQEDEEGRYRLSSY